VSDCLRQRRSLRLDGQIGAIKSNRERCEVIVKTLHRMRAATKPCPTGPYTEAVVGRDRDKAHAIAACHFLHDGTELAHFPTILSAAVDNSRIDKREARRVFV